MHYFFYLKDLQVISLNCLSSWAVYHTLRFLGIHKFNIHGFGVCQEHRGLYRGTKQPIIWLMSQQCEAGEQVQVRGGKVSSTGHLASPLTTDSHTVLVTAYVADLGSEALSHAFGKGTCQSHVQPLGTTKLSGCRIHTSLQSLHEIYKGGASALCDSTLVHSPPGTACHEAWKPLPFMKLSVLNRMASSFPVLDTCMGFSDDLRAHNWAILGE